MTRLEKMLAFSLLFLITALCVVLVMRRPVPCENQEKPDPVKEYDPVGQTYFSCSIEGTRIQSERWQTILEERNLSDKPLLVVWHSALGCSPCNDYVLNKTSDIPTKGLPLLIVGADFRSKTSSDRTVYLDRNESLGLITEDLKLPFVFIYDGEIRHLFFPSPGNQLVFDTYLDAILSRYGK